jgi:predicted transcriptional regulator
LLSWFEYKYRPRKKYYAWDNDKKYYVKLKEPATFIPAKNKTDLIFGLEFENHKKHKPEAVNQNQNQNQNQNIRVLYSHLLAQFDKVLDRLEVEYEDATKKRRKITLHSFRRYVKSIISDLGYSDFSEWYIGHAVSTYYRKSDKEKFQLFKRLDLNISILGRYYD